MENRSVHVNPHVKSRLRTRRGKRDIGYCHQGPRPSEKRKIDRKKNRQARKSRKLNRGN